MMKNRNNNVNMLLIPIMLLMFVFLGYHDAHALDTAITKVARAEKYCDSALNKVKVELLSAELACFEVVKAKLELDALVHYRYN